MSVNSILGLFQQGLEACIRGNVDEAIERFELALSVDRTHVPSWHMLGKCQQRKGNKEAASCAFAEVQRLNPQFR